MQGHPTIFVLPQEAVSSRCCYIIESFQVPPPDGEDQRISISGERTKNLIYYYWYISDGV